jgi:hypothetical protein
MIVPPPKAVTVAVGTTLKVAEATRAVFFLFLMRWDALCGK